MPAIDLVRLISILLVFALHFSLTSLPGQPACGLFARSWGYVLRNSVYGVSLFFVVSGYVITRSIVTRHPMLEELDLRGFYARRAARILPAFLLAVIVGAGILAWGPEPSRRVAFCVRHPSAVFDATFWISLATFSFNWLRIARESTSTSFGLHWDILWSLAVEEQFYLAYPLALRALRTRRRALTALLIVVASGPIARIVSTAVAPRSFLVTFTSSFVCFDLIAIGALLYFVLERLPERSHDALEPAIGLLAVVALGTVYRFTFLGDASDRVWAPSVIGLSLATFLGVAIRRRWFESPVSRVLVYPGQLSYGAYLFHPLMIYAGWRKIRGVPADLGFLAYSAATLTVAFILFRGFESPANRFVRARLSV